MAYLLIYKRISEYLDDRSVADRHALSDANIPRRQDRVVLHIATRPDRHRSTVTYKLFLLGRSGEGAEVGLLMFRPSGPFPITNLSFLSSLGGARGEGGGLKRQITCLLIYTGFFHHIHKRSYTPELITQLMLMLVV